ncbi:MAG: hypothetical protein JST04_13055 [Bdellovibrionales bacterium]|nr:hypothetical protein [Bdellovibrionales bacterium]
MELGLTFSIALAVQIVLGFFAPPIGLGERLVFFSDLWVFLWVPVFAFIFLREAPPSDRKRFVCETLVAGALLGIVFLHGYGRPSLAERFTTFIVSAPKDDLFSFGREAIITFRFFVWFVGGLLVLRLPVHRKIVDRTLLVCVCLSILSLAAAKFSPGARAFLGDLYRYDPNVPNWADRAFGAFRSPIEGCVTLCLALLILVQSPSESRATKIAVGGGVIVGVALTKTLTAFVSAGVAVLYATLSALSPKLARHALWISSVGVASALVLAWNQPFFSQKRETFLYRVRPWEVYWEYAISRIDRFLLGNGFHPHFSDNIYVFAFSRGGILLLGAALFAFGWWWKSRERDLTPFQKTIPIFFLISGLTVDSLIIRPVVYVLICAGVLALKSTHPSTETNI